LINIKDDDSIAAVAKVMNDEDEIQDVDDIDVTIEDNDNS
jgi:DNA gyrase subunit A